MTRWKPIAVVARSVLMATCFVSMAAASNYGPTAATKDLQGIINSEPGLETALIESLKKADFNDIDSLGEFYEYVTGPFAWCQPRKACSKK